MRLGASIAVPLIIFDQSLLQCQVGCFLTFAAGGGEYPESIGVGCAAEAPNHLRTGHLGYIRRVQLGRRAVIGRVHGFGQRLLPARFVNRAEPVHAPENPVAPLLAALGIDQWIEGRWRLRQAGDHGQLRQRQFVDRFAIVDLRGGFDPIRTIAEVDLVDVELEDLVLAEFAFDLQRQQYFVDLARKAALAGEEVVLRHLHGDGATAGLNLPRFQ